MSVASVLAMTVNNGAPRQQLYADDCSVAQARSWQGRGRKPIGGAAIAEFSIGLSGGSSADISVTSGGGADVANINARDSTTNVRRRSSGVGTL